MELKDNMIARVPGIGLRTARRVIDLLRRNLADAPQQMNLWPELRAA
jgi:Holliday junction resolvasome RuvABC DNA-binding subunit